MLLEIDKYNLVNKSTAVKPNYDLSNCETYINLYITREDDVIIVGEVDNNYIYWFSVTKLEEKAINEQIFNRLATGKYQYVSHEYLALQGKGLDYSVLANAYSTRFTREHTHNMAWKTPFGHYYGQENAEEHGSFFARDIVQLKDRLLQKCRIRQADGYYLQVLQQYEIEIEKMDYMRYELDIKPIYEILGNEAYLVLSPDDEAREAYQKCMELCSSKYNAYMTAVR